MLLRNLWAPRSANTGVRRSRPWSADQNKLRKKKKRKTSKPKFTRIKPHRNIGTTGHADHGKTTPTAATTKAPAEEGGATPKAYDQTDSAPEEKQRGTTTPTAHAEHETKTRHHAHIDRPGHADHVKNMITGAAQTDGATPAVPATDGPTPQTREHTSLPRQVGVPAIVVHINKVDQVSDETMSETAESEVRESSGSHKHPEDGTEMTPGPAPTAPKSEMPDIGEKSTRKPPEAIDSATPQPERSIDQPFSTPVEDASTTEGRGTVVTGKVERGAIKVGEEIETIGSSMDGTKTTRTGPEMPHKPSDIAEAGENAGAPPRGIKRTDIKRGQIPRKPGTIKAHRESEAQAHVPSKDEGGRHTPFPSNHQPQLLRRTADITGVIRSPEDVKTVPPGDHATPTTKPTAPVAVNEGLKPVTREGGRTVGAGVVSKIL